MKYLLAALSGMALTLCVFIGGAAFAIRYLAAEPVPVQRRTGASAALMPTDAVGADAVHRNIEPVENQIAAASRQEEASEPALDIDSIGSIEPRIEIEPMPAIDDLTTASITEPETLEPTTVREPAPSLSDRHVNWCRDRYRSYRAENNNYTPYSGGSRECVSPFSDDVITNHASIPEEDIIYLHDSAAAGSSEDIIYLDASARRSNEGRDEDDASSVDLSREHIESCFSRYRSYRPEDNTYQPYGGGPRRQCK